MKLNTKFEKKITGFRNLLNRRIFIVLLIL